MAVNVALDTNAYREFMRGDGDRVHVVRAKRTIALPLINLGELRAGFAAGNQESANAANLRRFQASPRVSILLPDEQTTHHCAQLHFQLRARDAAVPTNDIRIASAPVRHDLIFCTSGTHFRQFPQVATC